MVGAGPARPGLRFWVCGPAVAPGASASLRTCFLLRVWGIGVGRVFSGSRVPPGGTKCPGVTLLSATSVPGALTFP